MSILLHTSYSKGRQFLDFDLDFVLNCKLDHKYKMNLETIYSPRNCKRIQSPVFGA